MKTLEITASLLVALLAARPAWALQEGGEGAGETPPAAPQEPAPEEPRKLLEEWPELVEMGRVKKDIERLRRANTETMGVEASTALIADGAGVVPLLLPVYEKERDEEARARVRGVLDAVTKPEHAKLLAREFGHRAAHVRAWALSRAAACREPSLRAAAEQALARVQAQGEKADKEELYQAGLCTLASGSLAGLDAVRERAHKSWKKHGADIRAALEVVRGPAASEKLLPTLLGSKREERITTLRLLAGCGDAASAPALRPYLDDEDNMVRIETINALRGIVDKEPPFENLPVFDAIELAGKWKERLGGLR